MKCHIILLLLLVSLWFTLWKFSDIGSASQNYHRSVSLIILPNDCDRQNNVKAIKYYLILNTSGWSSISLCRYYMLQMPLDFFLSWFLYSRFGISPIEFTRQPRYIYLNILRKNYSVLYYMQDWFWELPAYSCSRGFVLLFHAPSKGVICVADRYKKLIRAASSCQRKVDTGCIFISNSHIFIPLAWSRYNLDAKAA